MSSDNTNIRFISGAKLRKKVEIKGKIWGISRKIVPLHAIMTFQKLNLCLLALFFCALGASAQSSGTYSTYSRFGIGLVNDGVTGFNRGMGGVGIALHSSNRINTLNPASYSTLDSLSMIFDVGASFSFGRQSQGNSSVSTRSATFEYAVMAFRMKPGLGISLGVVPYTTIQYNFKHTSPVGWDDMSESEIKNQQTFSGDGGTHRAYVGVGWQPFRKMKNPLRLLSIGTNVSIIWGTYDHGMIQSFTLNGAESGAYSAMLQDQSSKVLTYKIDLGIQLPIVLNNRNLLRTGFIAGLGHNVGSESTLARWTSLGDTTKVSIDNAVDIPYTFGGGVTWENKGMISVSADYRFEKWGDCRIPVAYTNDNGKLMYEARKGYYTNRHRMNVGAEFFPAVLNRGHNATYLERCRYRLGAFYSSPYMKVTYDNTGTLNDGPCEYGVTAGVGLPITNRINNRSVLNVAFEWLRRQPSNKNLITENYFMLHVGLSFNERWFMKYKIE